MHHISFHFQGLETVSHTVDSYQRYSWKRKQKITFNDIAISLSTILTHLVSTLEKKKWIIQPRKKVIDKRNHLY